MKHLPILIILLISRIGFCQCDFNASIDIRASEIGDKFVQVEVLVGDVFTYESLQFQINYDPTDLKYLSTIIDSDGEWNTHVNENQGYVRLSYYGLQSSLNVPANRVISTMIFERMNLAPLEISIDEDNYPPLIVVDGNAEYCLNIASVDPAPVALAYGRVLLDSNDDCLEEGEAAGCDGCIVNIVSENNSYQLQTDSLGMWSQELFEGNHQIFGSDPNGVIEYCNTYDQQLQSGSETEFPILAQSSNCANLVGVANRFQQEIELTTLFSEVEMIATIQYKLSWDPTVVSLQDFDFVLGNANHYYYDGVSSIAYSFIDIVGFQVPEDDILFRGNWEVLGAGDPAFEFSEVEFGDQSFSPICVAYGIQPILVGGKLTGKVLQDDGENCVYEEESEGYPFAYLHFYNDDNSYYRNTNELGQYEVIMPEGEYTIEFVDPNTLWYACDDELTATIVNDQVQDANVLIKADSECPLMNVNISTPRLRRCFDTNYYYVNWSNRGSAVAEDAYVLVSLDDALDFMSSSEEDAVYDAETHTIRLDLGNVDPLQEGSFNIRVEVQCEGVELGQTHCTTANVYPNTPCVTNDMWSGAELQVDAICVDGEVKVTITNIGEGVMTEQSDFIVIEDEIMYQQPSIQLMPQEQQEFYFDSEGKTITAIVTQPEYYHYGDMVSAAVELCGNSEDGELSLGYITMISSFDESPHVDIECTENIGSYDPNDKQAWPKGFAGTDLIENYIALDYMIRFQNTGTDTAFNIVVKDTLSEHLDLSSLRLGVSSHDYDFSIEGERTLVWRFNNILLPDSTTNLEGSNGFMKFSIDQVDGNPDGTLIDNQASIYFDFNDPIVTNVVRREVGSNFVSIGVNTIDEDLIPMDIFPNPTNDILRVEGVFDPAEMHYQLSNMNAQIQKQGNLNTQQISVQDISQGVYILQVLDKNEKVVARRKIVVIK